MKAVGARTRAKKGEKKKARGKPKPEPKPLRDKTHPLKVIAVCFKGERSGDAKRLIDKALKKMKYSQFVTVTVFHIRTAEQAKRYGFDIAIMPNTPRGESVLKSKKISAMLKDQGKKIVNYQTDNAGISLENGETLVNRIIRHAEKRFDLRF
jgi:hypothetical protein